MMITITAAFRTIARRLARGAAALRNGRPGQAMTEVVLLFPVFLVIVFITAKIFALLVLVQKLEIASFYAARRWQLESHLNAGDYPDDRLQKDIEDKVRGYIGFDNPSVAKFLNLQSMKLEVQRTQVWNVITLRVYTSPKNIKLLCRYPKQAVCAYPYGQDCMNGYDFMCVEPGNHQNGGGKSLEVIKYVPSRDRPIQFVLPGIKD
ncbi:MAG: TadE family protein [Elusimicrobiota bacterium]